MFLCGIFFSIVALFGAAVLLFDPAVKGSDPGVLAATLVFAAGAWWCFGFRRDPERYLVETSDYGISVGGHAFVPWSDVASLRERMTGQRLELRGASGEKLAAVEYQLTNIAELIEEVRQRSRVSRTRSERRLFGKRRAMPDLLLNLALFLSLGGAGVWLWFEERNWIGLVLLPILVRALYTDLRDNVREIEIRERDLAIRTFLRERVIPRVDIREVALVLRPLGMNQRLSCGIGLHSGEAVWLAPRSIDVIELHEALRQWLDGR